MRAMGMCGDRTKTWRCLPVESECLNQTEYTLSEECVDAKGGVRLVQNGKNAVTKHQRDESVVSFHAMLNVDGREELEPILRPPTETARFVHVSHDGDEEDASEEIKGDADNDKSQLTRPVDVHAADPEGNCCCNE